MNYSLHYTVIAALSLLLYTGISFADDFGELAKRCAPEVSEDTLRALVRTESSFNPYAIGIVGGGSRQPKAFHEAMAIIAQLELEGKNYSVGLAQINKKNFSKLGINAARGTGCVYQSKSSVKNPFRLLPKSAEEQRQQLAARCLELLLLRKLSDRLPAQLRG